MLNENRFLGTFRGHNTRTINGLNTNVSYYHGFFLNFRQLPNLMSLHTLHLRSTQVQLCCNLQYRILRTCFDTI